MRSTLNDCHLSGAERIAVNEFSMVLPELVMQALSSCDVPDRIVISVDKIDPSSVTYTAPLRVRTIESSSSEDAAGAASEVLRDCGISPAAVEKAFHLLSTGPASGGRNMRGAVIMDGATGERMEPDKSRGVRVSRVDYTADARQTLITMLSKQGIFHRRVMDALAIASKVSGRSETAAELCWSDDPDYTTGYVASQKSGYVRITNMKKLGDSVGGRVFFVNSKNLNLDEYIFYMEKKPVLISLRPAFMEFHPSTSSG